MATMQVLSQSFPYSSEYKGMASDGKTPVYDRAISSAIYRKIWNTYFTQGILDLDNDFIVQPDAGLNIQATTGACFIDGVTTVSNNVISMLVEAPSTTADRIDRVVIQNNYTDRYTYIYIKKGEDGGGAPELTRSAEIYEIGLADISVRRNVLEIATADITDLRADETLCGKVKNKGEYDWEGPVKALQKKKLLAIITSTMTFNIADFGLSIGDEIDAYLVGGGGGSAQGYGNGGGGGYCKFIRNYVLSQSSYPIVIGAGGNCGTQAAQAGGNGGATSAFGVTMNGGFSGGTYNNFEFKNAYGDGGSGGGSSLNPNNSIYTGADGGSNGSGGSGAAGDGGRGGGNVKFDPINPYDGIAYGCGGGGADTGKGGGAGGNGGSARNSSANGGSGKLGGGGGAGTKSIGPSNISKSNGGLGGGGAGACACSVDYHSGYGGQGLVYIYADTSRDYSIPNTFTTTGSATAYELTIPDYVGRIEGTTYFAIFHAQNTTTNPTLTVNGVNYGAILKDDGTALTNGWITANSAWAVQITAGSPKIFYV